jgi:hypothetical protein
VVTEIGFYTDQVTDISPVRALAGLNALGCKGNRTPNGGKLSDLSPLEGMPLTFLVCYFTKVSDLSPLKQAKLTYLHCGRTQVTDLSPLAGMPLTYLAIANSKFSDLTPLKGMPLESLWCSETRVTNLSPLKGLPLTNFHCMDTPVSDLLPLEDCKGLMHLQCAGTKVTPAAVAALQKALPNCKIEWDDPTKPKTLEQPVSVDLLRLVDPKQSFNGGTWSKGLNGMASPTEEFEWALVRVPYVAPEEYDWRIVVERADNTQVVKPVNNSGRSLALHFNASGNRGSVCLDGYHNGTCALEMIDKKVGPSFQGPIMKPGKPVAVLVSIRKDSIVVAADGKEILTWRGDMGRFRPIRNGRYPTTKTSSSAVRPASSFMR